MALRKRKAPTKAERQRWRVFEQMGSPDIEPHVLIQNMDMVLKWLSDGIVRTADGKPKLRVAGTGQ